MDTQKLVDKFTQTPQWAELDNLLAHNKQVAVAGLKGSLKALFAAAMACKTGENYIYILRDKEEASYFYNDLAQCLPEKSLRFFPTSYKRSIIYGQQDQGNLIQRTEALDALARNEHVHLVSYPEALIEKVVTPEKLSENTLYLSKGEELSLEFIEEVLQSYDFQLVDFVFEPGQYAIRGSIVDIFSYAHDYPYRLDFFGDEVESIRTFDIENQLSINDVTHISIVPNLQNGEETNRYQDFLEFIPQSSRLLFYNKQYILDVIENTYQKALTHLTDEEETEETEQRIHLLTHADNFKNQHNQFTSLNLLPGSSKHEEQAQISFSAQIQPVFNKKFELLAENITSMQEKGYEVFITTPNPKQVERLRAIFEEIAPKTHFTEISTTLHEGFIWDDQAICCYTDHQIFERYHRFQVKSGFNKKEAVSIRELNELQPGDYVVHVDHGIGKFGGLEKIRIHDKVQEAIKLVYKDRDTLYVSIHSLHKISKYKSKEAEPPKIYKLGTGTWQKVKNKTKQKVKDIARDLIQLYAKRKEERGFAFSADTYLQRELESSFIYEDTPDQLSATEAVKQDMESTVPMDRLVCGDVGFGKTEIAIRAAFKAITDNKQVAILVPTTILALQHYQTFKERLADFPCTVEYISRLRARKAQTQIKKDLAEGKVDIIIGTHRLVGKDLQFKELGLLIIDEEQKFGVAVKEKLRALKVNVDTLTLTATPIPRTLQFSLMGARDLSIINTPPPNRYPIITELHTFNEDIIKEAVSYEFNRNGQIFFINNRIDNIQEVEKLINRLVPEARTVIAHGQMEGPKLEKIMLDFIQYEYDVLISTTIIESGLDIPRANTIIINNAQNFGLSELHQLRGRVGRSNKKAFAYLLAPPLISVSNDARRRLEAIEQFSALGSGFNIAMQDLDIRGAGDMLGAEQSGFIADIGYETYQRILNEAMLELREDEFKSLFAKEDAQAVKEQLKTQKFITDCQIDTDMELLFPDSYIQNIAARVRLYRELDNLTNEQELEAFTNKLIDQFGKIPTPTQELINVVRLRWLAIDLGFEKIILKQKKMVLHFPHDPESLYYQSPIFAQILNYVQQHPKAFRMKEGKNRLSLSASPVATIHHAIDMLKNIKNT
jgi:transcription-repair coupling factor (superfamily II helicase)